MILSDGDIFRCMEKFDMIQPFNPDNVQPASYDVSLSYHFRVFKRDFTHIDPMTRQDLTKRVMVEHGAFVLHPGELVLGSTMETIYLPPWIAARVEGKSSLGRLGLVIHSTAGWIDPGYRGTITLEISNNAPLPIMLHPHMLIGQIAFMELKTPAAQPYGHPDRRSKYQGDVQPTESRYHEEYQ